MALKNVDPLGLEAEASGVVEQEAALQGALQATEAAAGPCANQACVLRPESITPERVSIKSAPTAPTGSSCPGSCHDEFKVDSAYSSEMAKAFTETMGGATPVVGELMDAHTIADPKASTGDKLWAAGALLVPFVTGKILKKVFNGEVPDTPSPTPSPAKMDDYPEPVGGSGGRLGNAATREHVAQVADEMESRGWQITHGGGRAPEEYLPGPGGARKGSSYPDITATKKNQTLRVNTVDTRADGVTMTTREARNAARIRSQTGEHLLTVPKPKPKQ